MTKENLYRLTVSLYESSIYIREVNEKASDMLLEMSSELAEVLSRYGHDEEVMKEISDITKELLDV